MFCCAVVCSFPVEISRHSVLVQQRAFDAGEKLRPVGSALSPNGLGFADGGEGDMVSCSLMDKVVEVDRVSGRVHVQVYRAGPTKIVFVVCVHNGLLYRGLIRKHALFGAMHALHSIVVRILCSLFGHWAAMRLPVLQASRLSQAIT